MKKENILKKIGDYLDTVFSAEEIQEVIPEVVAAEAPVEELPPTETPAPELKVGDPLPDGEYEIMDQIVILKDGKIESIVPKEKPVEEAPEEEMAKAKSTEDLEKEIAAIESKLSAQKEAFELELSKLSEANKASGIIQAPVEQHTEPRVYTAKERILRTIEGK